MDILNYDCFSHILNNLKIDNIINIELVSKNNYNLINKYIINKYNINFISFKKNLYLFYNDIDILHNLLNNNKTIFKNINIYYKYVNINNFNNLIKMMKNNYNYKSLFLKIFKFYTKLFHIIINNINITNIFFFQLNKTLVNQNVYYLFVNIKHTFKNFYNFLILYNYLKYFINNNKITI